MKIDITKFTNFLTESYVNLFDTDKRKWDYLDQVWDMLQESYKRMKGFHSVKTKEDLVTECKMWKLSKKNGKVIAKGTHDKLMSTCKYYRSLYKTEDSVC